jgi:hypothetical protein
MILRLLVSALGALAITLVLMVAALYLTGHVTRDEKLLNAFPVNMIFVTPDRPGLPPRPALPPLPEVLDVQQTAPGDAVDLVPRIDTLEDRPALPAPSELDLRVPPPDSPTP